MDNIRQPHIALLCKLMQLYGVADVVVSPGSRNASVVVFFARSGMFKLHYVVDERSAAFVALGISSAARRPVAMVCTSGSAVMNYAPALAEALYRHVPLLAITADRPAQAIGKRLPQTMEQPGALEAVTLGCLDISAEMSLDDLNCRLNAILRNVSDSNCGPIHINVRVNEPFEFAQNIVYPPQARRIELIRPGSDKLNELIAELNSKRVLAVFGGMHKNERLQTEVMRLVDGMAINAIAEAQANLPKLPAPDRIDFVKTDADIVVRCGGSFVSKALMRWLRTKQLPVIDIGFDTYPCDNTGTLRANVAMSPADFFALLQCRNKGLGKLAERPLPDFAERRAIKQILDAAPEGMILHLGNGLSVRAAQGLDMRKFGEVSANRGISGIDGCTSTAVGAAMACDREVLLVTGDMSAAYDVAALAINSFPKNFRMAVVNNGEGGIFNHVSDLITIPEAENYCRQVQKFPIKELAEAYGMAYTEQVAEFYALAGPVILNYKI